MIADAVRLGRWTFDAGLRQLLDEAGTSVHLTPKAFDLLAILIEYAPRVVRKADLHTQLWPDAFVSDATLAGLVKEIRRVLPQDDGAPVLRTSHGIGYAISGSIDRLPRPLTDRWLIVLGRRHALKLGENVIGRDPSADVWLAASGVSRRHARIVVTAEGSSLHDLGSKNGTRLEGVLLSSTADLNNGDLITIGPFSIVYGSADAPISTETLAL